MPRVRIAVGCHPHNAKYYDDGLEADLRRMLKDPRVAALGEIGLDYHYDFSPRDDQREAFRRQLRLAKEAGLPVALHLREAHDEALAIMREEGFPEAGTLLHCFNLDWATLGTVGGRGVLRGVRRRAHLQERRRHARGRSPRAGGSSAHRDGCAVHDARTYARHDLPRRSRAGSRRSGSAEACGRAPGTQREEFLARLMDNARELLDRPATAWQKNKGA